jgi:hypothetical protein
VAVNEDDEPKRKKSKKKKQKTKKKESDHDSYAKYKNFKEIIRSIDKEFLN